MITKPPPKFHEPRDILEFDLEIVEDALIDAVREQLGEQRATVVDELRLATDVAARRYE